MEDIPVPGASEALDRPRLRSTGKPAGHTTSVRLAWGRGNPGTFRQLPQLSPRPPRSDFPSRMVVITVAVPQALQGDSFGSLAPAEVVVDDVRVTNKLVHGWRWRLEAVVADHDLYGGEPGTCAAIIRSRRITGLTPDVIAELIFETGPLPQDRHQATPALRPRRRAVGAGPSVRGETQAGLRRPPIGPPRPLRWPRSSVCGTAPRTLRTDALRSGSLRRGRRRRAPERRWCRRWRLATKSSMVVHSSNTVRLAVPSGGLVERVTLFLRPVGDVVRFGLVQEGTGSPAAAPAHTDGPHLHKITPQPGPHVHTLNHNLMNPPRPGLSTPLHIRPSSASIGSRKNFTNSSAPYIIRAHPRQSRRLPPNAVPPASEEPCLRHHRHNQTRPGGRSWSRRSSLPNESRTICRN